MMVWVEKEYQSHRERQFKFFLLYKKTLGISKKSAKSKGLSQRPEDRELEAWPMDGKCDEKEPAERHGTNLSDVELYEN